MPFLLGLALVCSCSSTASPSAVIWSRTRRQLMTSRDEYIGSWAIALVVLVGPAMLGFAIGARRGPRLVAPFDISIIALFALAAPLHMAQPDGQCRTRTAWMKTLLPLTSRLWPLCGGPMQRSWPTARTCWARIDGSCQG